MRVSVSYLGCYLVMESQANWVWLGELGQGQAQ